MKRTVLSSIVVATTLIGCASPALTSGLPPPADKGSIPSGQTSTAGPGPTTGNPDASSGTQDASSVAAGCAAPTSFVPATALGSVPADTIQLSVHGTTVYGITSHNDLWSLSSSPGAAQYLLKNNDKIVFPSEYPSVVATNGYLFWVDRLHGVLHRTRGDGSADTSLASVSTPNTFLAADSTSVYWAEDPYVSQGDGTILALPVDAASGATPSTTPGLGNDTMIGSLVDASGVLYWTELFWPTTMPNPSIWTASASSLFPQGAGSRIAGATYVSGLFGTSRGIYAIDQSSRTAPAVVGMVDVSGAIQGLAPVPASVSGVVGIVTTASSVVLTAKTQSGLSLYVLAKDGGAFMPLGCSLLAPAAQLGEGITFVDSSSTLFSMSDGALSSVH